MNTRWPPSTAISRRTVVRLLHRHAPSRHLLRCARRSATPTRIQGCYWPYSGQINSDAAAPCSQLICRHLRHMNAYLQADRTASKQAVRKAGKHDGKLACQVADRLGGTVPFCLCRA